MNSFVDIERTFSGQPARLLKTEWLRPHVVREVTGEAEYMNENLAR